jgi:sulfate adenylyltransferase subunit 2
MAALTHLQRLEAESIDIMREAVSEAEKPVMLYSIGKHSSVMLHLATKAFYPSKPPFPLLHVDTTWKFREVSRPAGARAGVAVDRPHQPRGRRAGDQPLRARLRGAYRHLEDPWIAPGARPIRLQSRLRRRPPRRGKVQGEGADLVVSLGAAPLGPKLQSPELWRLYNARKNKGENIRVLPLSNWTELDVWEYIYLERIPIVPLYFANERPVVRRDGALIYDDQLAVPEADSKRLNAGDGELDFALLLDGLAAEREQGITIDVTHRFFSTDERKFIVADTPGHEQYTPATWSPGRRLRMWRCSSSMPARVSSRRPAGTAI